MSYQVEAALTPAASSSGSERSLQLWSEYHMCHTRTLGLTIEILFTAEQSVPRLRISTVRKLPLMVCRPLDRRHHIERHWLRFQRV